MIARVWIIVPPIAWVTRLSPAFIASVIEARLVPNFPKFDVRLVHHHRFVHISGVIIIVIVRRSICAAVPNIGVEIRKQFGWDVSSIRTGVSGLVAVPIGRKTDNCGIV